MTSLAERISKLTSEEKDLIYDIFNSKIKISRQEAFAVKYCMNVCPNYQINSAFDSNKQISKCNEFFDKKCEKINNCLDIYHKILWDGE